MMLFSYVILLVFIKVNLSLEDNPVVNLKSGKYVGKYNTTYDGVEYLSFRGIKFATVEKRFEEGVPMKNSNETFSAEQYGPPCFQPNANGTGVIGVEDCLYLNVFSPNLNGSLPVIVYIYGGSFTSGSSDRFSPEYFMSTKKVVIVIISYRIGAFGFLYLDDAAFPANLALRDQILALRWVQSNIKYFGGNADRVTISGQSAGAASVSLLMHSPMTKGLFKGAISQSGSACALWAAQPRCTGLQRLRMLSEKLNCSQFLPKKKNSSAQLVKCLRSKAPELYLTKTSNLELDDKIVPFPPIVESASVTNPVINYYPWLQKSNSVELVPWITGSNSNEGFSLVANNLPKSEVTVKLYQGIIMKILPSILFYENTATNPTVTSLKILNQYQFLYLFNFNEFLIKIVSEGHINYPMMKCLETISSPKYSYYFDYIETSQLGKQTGVSHSGELKFIWPRDNKIRLNGSKSDINISNSLVNTWIDFAYNQSGIFNFSGVTWEKYDYKKDKMLVIDNSGVRMATNPMKQINMFWSTLKSGTTPKTTDCL